MKYEDIENVGMKTVFYRYFLFYIQINRNNTVKIILSYAV